MSRTRISAFWPLVAVLALGCKSSDSGNPPPAGTGGATSTGGSSGTGGSTGGSSGTGGSASGGAPGSADASSPTGGSAGGGSDAAVTDGAAPATDGAVMAVDAGGGTTPTMMLTGNGCAGGKCLNPTCMPSGAKASIGSFAAFGFDEDEHYIPNDVLVPTFDDVPDRAWLPADDAIDNRYTFFKPGDWTKQMLDWMDQNDLHFDFFINANNFCDVNNNASCRDVVTRILAKHNAGNHTIHHIHMGSALPYDAVKMFNNGCGASGDKLNCDDEMKGVETLVNTLSGGGLPHLTRFRAPYGEPFMGGGAGVASTRITVAKYAVHVGWQMDSTDSLCDNCKYTGQQIAGVVEKAVNGGKRGIILMHGTYPWSYEAAKLLFDPSNGFAKSKNLRLGTVEDAICWKYGMHSWDIVTALNAGQTRTSN